jgi:hypothetical protein
MGYQGVCRPCGSCALLRVGGPARQPIRRDRDNRDTGERGSPRTLGSAAQWQHCIGSPMKVGKAILMRMTTRLLAAVNAVDTAHVVRTTPQRVLRDARRASTRPLASLPRSHRGATPIDRHLVDGRSGTDRDVLACHQLDLAGKACLCPPPKLGNVDQPPAAVAVTSISKRDIGPLSD